MKSKQVIRSAHRYEANHGWLKSYHLFSFAEYFNPFNTQFGNLRVFNDDFIGAHSGFPLHPHREMEIVTILLSGAVSHGDSMGNVTKVEAGEVQRMSAGTGVFHSEENNEDELLHLYQIWIHPKEAKRVPSYEQKKFVPVKNTLQLLVSDKQKGGIDIGADVEIFQGDFDEDAEIIFEIQEGRGSFLYIQEGEMEHETDVLYANDQLRLKEMGKHIFRIQKNTKFVVIDVKL